MRLRYRLALSPGAKVRIVGDARIQVEGVRGAMETDLGSARIATLIAALESHDISEMEIVALAATTVGDSPARLAHQALQQMKTVRALAYRVACGGAQVARVMPLTSRPYRDRETDAAIPDLALGFHTRFKADENGLHIATPLADAEVVIDPSLARDFAASVCGHAPARPDPRLALLAHVLFETGHLRGSRLAAETQSWEFHDIVFHAASRLAANSGPFGRRDVSNPARHAAPDAPQTCSGIELPVTPTIDAARQTAFGTVLRNRKSRREPGPEPLKLDRLAAFLAIAATPADEPGATASGAYPYPAPGGIHALKTYLAVQRCQGLSRGIYLHSAERRQLHPVEGSSDAAATLAAHCGRALGLSSAKPDVVIVVCASFAAVRSRYDAIAYRLILVTAGCLLQNMYLAASALNLAGCAVGAGMPAVFAAATGANTLSEPSILEFALSAN